MKTAVEMTGRGHRGKPKAGFPPRPQPLEIAEAAIPTFPPPRRAMEKWKAQKQAFPLFHSPDFICLTDLRKEARRRSFAPPSRLIVRLENAGIQAEMRSACQYAAWPDTSATESKDPTADS